MSDTPQPPAITDSHCHLDFPDFDGQLDAIIARAAEVGVTRMVTICTRLRNEPTVRAIAETYAPVFFAAGTHPMSASEEPLASVDELVELSRHPKFVGIGETGLDYHYTADSADVQKQSLRIHIEAAFFAISQCFRSNDKLSNAKRIIDEFHALALARTITDMEYHSGIAFEYRTGALNMCRIT